MPKNFVKQISEKNLKHICLRIKKKKMAMKLPKKVLAGSNEIAKVILKENAPELSKEFLGIAEQIHKRI